MELKDIAVIYDCPHSTAPDEGVGYALIRTPNIGKGRLLLDNVHRVSKEVYDNRNRRAIPQEGDIIFAREAPAGNAALITRGQKVCLGQRTVLIKPNHSVCDSGFLVYYLLAPEQQTKLLGFSHGATVQHVNISELSKLSISLPSLYVQHRIASILSAYDNLIENNNKRIRLLEQMAENLYKEWFAYHKIKGSAKEIRLTEIVSYNRGLSYSSDEIDCEDGNDLINLKNIQAFGGFRLDGTKRYNGQYKKEQVVKEGDLIMGVTDMTQDRRTVGSVALIPNISNLSVISADLIKLNSVIDNVFFYALFRWGNVSKYISQFANGANVLHLRPQVLRNVKVLLPQQILIDKFVSVVKPMIGMINKLNTENESLSRQRDLLLPRLMSGKLEVNI
jgi:type I restriction enzyme S subunit